MAIDLSEEELAKVMAGGERIDEFDFRDDDDEDNYVSAALYKMGGDSFRVIESSGMNSQYAGAENFGERLTPEEAARWTEF